MLERVVDGEIGARRLVRSTADVRVRALSEKRKLITFVFREILGYLRRHFLLNLF